MGIFDKSNYTVNTGIIEQVFQRDTVGEDDWNVDILWECGSQLVKYIRLYRLLCHYHQEDVHV